MTSIIDTSTPAAMHADQPTEESTDKPSGKGDVIVYVDPATIIIGSNVRTDLPDAREFRRSIKQRGVLEPVTVYRADDGALVCLRGQRRTVEAATVGTPTGLIPARITARPAEADRIVDQMVENIHRTGMRDSEIVAGVEDLALIGISAAQITKRLSVPRPTVNAALAVTKATQSRARLASGDLTLDQAAIFAEFEHDPDAVARLEKRLIWNQSLEHEAQRLRDQAAERAEYHAEVTRLRDQGLPVLTREEAAGVHLSRQRLDDMRTPEGEPVPEAEWPTVASAAVYLDEEWHYPTHNQAGAGAGAGAANVDGEDGQAATDDEADEVDEVEPVRVFVPVWVVTDPEISGLVHRFAASGTGASAGTGIGGDGAGQSEAQVEARREERRKVIANNKAWASAETVRGVWLASFVARKTAPKGAETLICEALITGNHALTRAMEHRHSKLFKLLGIESGSEYYGAGYEECEKLAAKATTPKAATMTALAAVVAAWEDSTGKHTWRNPSPWDARILGALVEWGYQPSDVERLLLGEESGGDHGTDG